MSFEPIESYGVIGVHHFAINIQLQLLIGRVSDTHGPRVFIPQRALRLAEKRSLSGPFDTWLRTRDVWFIDVGFRLSVRVQRVGATLARSLLAGV